MKENIIKKVKAEITERTLIAPEIYSMTFHTDIGKDANPGQFVLVYPQNGAKLLGRPVCIASAGEESLRIVFRTVGSGTKEIAGLSIGEMADIEGPLGSGYPLSEVINKNKSVVLLGGGLGAPSLLYLAQVIKAKDPEADVLAVLGYRSSEYGHFLSEDMEMTGVKTLIATDDGSEGIRGNVIEALKTSGTKADVIYACGPMPMLSAVKKYAEEIGSKAYISLEEHMACGLGVCLGCVVKTREKDSHSMVNNARICTEGPVFDARIVDI